MPRLRSVLPRRASLLLAFTSLAVFAAGCGDGTPTATPAPSRISLDIVSGDAQVGDPGRELPEALRVVVLNESNQPVPGVVVNFRVVSGGGEMYAGAALTDAQGRAADWWTLGPASADTQRVEVRAVDPVTAQRRVYATFKALTRVTAGFTVAVTPASLSIQAGGSGPASVALARIGDFSDVISLAASGAPSGVTMSFTPSSVIGGFATTSISVAANVAPGTYPITVTGSAPGRPDATASLSLTVTAAPAAGAPGSLTNGQAYTGRIARAGQTDTWTFTATQGDYVALGLGEGTAAADFAPWIRLYGPTGEVLGNNWNAAATGLGRNLPSTGTYSVVIGTNDSGNDATGDYRLSFIKSPGASVVPAGDEGGPLTNSIVHTGTIGVGDLDHWTFTATQGDYIALSLGEGTAAADFAPWIRFVSPTGELLESDWNAAVTGVGRNAPATGTYTVIVGTNDSGNDATGEYRLTLALARPPGAILLSPGDEGGAITPGAIHAGNIDVGDIDQWTFTATQGEYIALSIGEGTAAADFAPWIRLIGPTGELLGNDWNATVTGVSRTAPATGLYSVIIGTNDSGNDATGAYRLTLVKSPGALVVSANDQGGALTNGAGHAGSIAVGDIDAWTFDALQGDYVALAVGEGSASADFAPWIRLIGPNGELLGNDWNAAVTGISRSLPSSGRYTVIIGTNDSGNDATGDYRLSIVVQRPPGEITVSTGDEGGPMTNGTTHRGSITIGDIDHWSFTATQGDYIALALGEESASADFAPWIRLIGPTGQLLGNDWNAAATGISRTAPSTGVYTVIIGTNDSGNDATGDYRLTLARAPGTFLLSAGDEGGAMTPGTSHTGSIFVGDVDQWTFSATQGTAIVLRITEGTASADFTPWIRLIGPTGELLGNDWNATTTTITRTLPSTGVYTVLVGTADSGNDATGNYTLVVTGGVASESVAKPAAKAGPAGTAQAASGGRTPPWALPGDRSSRGAQRPSAGAKRVRRGTPSGDRPRTITSAASSRLGCFAPAAT